MNTKALTENEIFLSMESMRRLIVEINSKIEMYIVLLNEKNNEADKMHIKELLNQQESNLKSCTKIHNMLARDLMGIAKNKLYPKF